LYSESKYKLEPLTNALQWDELESPVPPFDGSSDYDNSKFGIVFSAKRSQARSFNTYYTQVICIAMGYKKVCFSKILWFNGAIASSRFSPDGKSIAYLVMVNDGYEDDKNHVLIISDVECLSNELIWLYST
jgi:hypothetical protein